MAKRVPGLPDNWQQYCVCLLLHPGLPFLLPPDLRHPGVQP